jgi:hypothetical protein
LTALIEGGDRFKRVGLLDDDYVVILSSDHRRPTTPSYRSNGLRLCRILKSLPAETTPILLMIPLPSGG